MHLHTNRFSGQIPAGLGSLADLTDLWLHDNQFSGELPAELGNLATLERVSLWGNQLSWAESYPPGILADLVALLALYESTGGENWADNANWLTAGAGRRMARDHRLQRTGHRTGPPTKPVERETAAAVGQPRQPGTPGVLGATS